MKVFKKISYILILFVCIFMMSSCVSVTTNGTTTQAGPIRIIEDSMELSIGESKRIRYEKLTSADLNITFLTGNPAVATVNKVGYVRAVGAGETTIEIEVDSFKYHVNVVVTRGLEFTPPTKLIYSVGEELDLTGSKIIDYELDGTVKEEIAVTSSMVSGFSTDETGSKVLTVRYETYTFTFTITVNDIGGAEIYDFESPTIGTLNVGDVNTIVLEPLHKAKLVKTLASLYDYEEFEVSFDIVTPENDTDTIYAFYTQDYTESHNTSQFSTSRVYEGSVISKAGYNYRTEFTPLGEGYYAVRYNPSVAGTYTYTMNIKVSGELLHTKTGSFRAIGTNTDKGIIKVSSNNLSFEFEDGTSYVPVGANVAWYSSADRRYNDYTLMLDGMKRGGYNYIRQWMAAWGTCLWWENITNYNNRLDEALEQDLILDMMEEAGIYVNLTLYHHGMFSSKTNPMWKGSSNSWYTSKYGYNPYSDVISSGAAFFSNEYAKKWTKNYLKYVIARYTSYDSIMSYELFNEIDWIEDYNIAQGKTWHEEMAEFIKETDYRCHMVTSSIKSDKGSVAQSIFSIDAIDYANFHIYAGYNFLSLFSSSGPSYVSAYSKPVMIQECGYSGTSGQAQHDSDPSDTSLHAQIWGGIMTTASTGMPWWWDSWIEKYDSYEAFKGASIYSSYMNLSGSYTYIQNTSKVSISNTSSVAKMGLDFGSRKYIYLYNKQFKVGTTGNNTSTTMTVTLDSGNYNVKTFNTFTGAILSNENKTVSLGTLQLSLSFTDDIAIIIEKI